jgi:hypothetical protein
MYVKCFDNSIYKPKLAHYTQHPTPNTQHPTPNTQHPTPNTQQRKGEDINKTFVDMLEEEVHDIYQNFKEITPIGMTPADIANYKNVLRMQ